MSTNQIRLDELLARSVDVQWFEGVAVVQAICRQLLATSASNGEFPAATQIGLGADGAVRVLDTTATKAVPAAAHLLAGLLSDDVPVRLRLAVSQATGDNSTFESLREFSETLGYFERPDTDVIVRSLVERAMLAGVRQQTDERHGEDVGAARKRETAVAPPRATKVIWRRAAVAVGVATTLGATSWLVVMAVNGGGANAAFSGIANTLVGGGQARPDEPLEKSVAAAEIATAGTGRLQRTHSSTANRSQGQSGGTRKESGRRLGARMPSFVPSFAAAMSPMPTGDPSNATEPARTYVIEAVEPVGSSPDQIYSVSDADVTPPQQVYPALPADLPTASLKRPLTVIDLVIAPDGVVERVRLRTTPRDIHEFMLLSAAKAWRFEPALRDGRPVRFRHSVALTSFQ